MRGLPYMKTKVDLFKTGSSFIILYGNWDYGVSGLKSKLFVFSVLWHILLSISSIKCHKRARFGKNIAELLLIPCINHIENESKYHIYSIFYTSFFRQSAKSLRTDFLNQFDLRLQYGVI